MITIRAMDEPDLDTVAEIEAETFSTPWSRSAFQRLIADPGPVRAWVALGNQRDAPVGYAVYWFTVDEGELANIAVAPASRGQGVGKALLEHVIGVARRDGVSNLFLEVRASNQVAISLYTRYGFERVGLRRRYYNEPSEDALVLRMRLAPFTS